MTERVLFGPGGATEAKQDDALGELASILSELQQHNISYWATQGRAFNITSGLVTEAEPGEQSLAVLLNPAGSGKDIWLDLGEFGSSADTTFRRFRGSTITPTGTPITAINMSGSGTTSVAQMYVGGTEPTFTFTGGVVTKTAYIAAYQQYITELKGRVRLRPGNSIRWSITNSSALGNTLTASVFLEYWEIDAT